MKILIVNGSPKGDHSITLHTCLYIKKHFQDHDFEVLHAGQRSAALLKDLSPLTEKMRQADLVLFSYPVYTFLVPSQLHALIEKMKEEKLSFEGKYMTQITTSKHFYDVTAHRFMEENCTDLGMTCLPGLSADMEDLLCEKGRQQALDFFRSVCWRMEGKPALPERKGPFEIVIVTDLREEDAGLKEKISLFKECLSGMRVRVENLRDFPFAGGCIGCMNCAPDGKCIYKDGFDNPLQTGLRADKNGNIYTGSSRVGTPASGSSRVGTGSSRVGTPASGSTRVGTSAGTGSSRVGTPSSGSSRVGTPSSGSSRVGTSAGTGSSRVGTPSSGSSRVGTSTTVPTAGRVGTPSSGSTRVGTSTTVPTAGRVGTPSSGSTRVGTSTTVPTAGRVGTPSTGSARTGTSTGSGNTTRRVNNPSVIRTGTGSGTRSGSGSTIRSGSGSNIRSGSGSGVRSSSFSSGAARSASTIGSGMRASTPSIGSGARMGSSFGGGAARSGAPMGGGARMGGGGGARMGGGGGARMGGGGGARMGGGGGARMGGGGGRGGRR